MLSVVVDDQARAELALDLDELFREGARRMLAVALEAEVEAYIAAHAELVDEHGHRLVVRNGHAPARTISTGVGQVDVVRPRVDDRRVDPGSGQRVQFHSGLLPRWCRRSPKVAEVLPLLYLHGLSSLDFLPALEAFFGARAGLSASVITRLTTQWQADREAFAQRSLADRDYVYCWADGIQGQVPMGAAVPTLAGVLLVKGAGQQRQAGVTLANGVVAPLHRGRVRRLAGGRRHQLRDPPRVGDPGPHLQRHSQGRRRRACG